MKKTNENKVWMDREDYINYLSVKTNEVHISDHNSKTGPLCNDLAFPVCTCREDAPCRNGGCYCMKGRQQIAVVQAAYTRNLRLYNTDPVDFWEQVKFKIKHRPYPLALYLFTMDQQHQTQVLHNVLYGGGCVNDTVMHVASGYLPFGGIGSSGMGSYHGKKSFDTFSHAKSVLKSAARLDTNLRYPPYKEKTMKLVKKILK